MLSRPLQPRNVVSWWKKFGVEEEDVGKQPTMDDGWWQKNIEEKKGDSQLKDWHGNDDNTDADVAGIVLL